MNLKDCPFCAAKIDSTNIIGTAFDEYYAFCDSCGACSGLRKTKIKAKNAWNKRIDNSNKQKNDNKQRRKVK